MCCSITPGITTRNIRLSVTTGHRTDRTCAGGLPPLSAGTQARHGRGLPAGLIAGRDRAAAVIARFWTHSEVSNLNRQAVLAFPTYRFGQHSAEVTAEIARRINSADRDRGASRRLAGRCRYRDRLGRLSLSTGTDDLGRRAAVLSIAWRGALGKPVDRRLCRHTFSASVLCHPRPATPRTRSGWAIPRSAPTGTGLSRSISGHGLSARGRMGSMLHPPRPAYIDPWRWSRQVRGRATVSRMSVLAADGVDHHRGNEWPLRGRSRGDAWAGPPGGLTPGGWFLKPLYRGPHRTAAPGYLCQAADAALSCGGPGGALRHDRRRRADDRPLTLSLAGAGRAGDSLHRVGGHAARTADQPPFPVGRGGWMLILRLAGRWSC